MSGNSLNAILFLISTVFDFYTVVLIMRLVLAWVGADYHHPITQFVVKLTNPVIKPLKRFIPDLRGVEIATVIIIVLVEACKYFVITMLSFGLPNVLGLFILALGDAIRLILQTLTLALILQVILSWIQPNSPVYDVLHKFTSPIIRPLQRVIPPVAGIDIAPLPAIIILQLLVIILVNPMKGLGLGVAIGA